MVAYLIPTNIAHPIYLNLFTPTHILFEAEWYNYGRGTTGSAFLHGMVQVAAGVHKQHDLDDAAGMASLFETALQYLHGVPRDFYGLDVIGVRTRVTNLLEAPAELSEWQVRLDGETPRATDADYAYLDGLP